MTKRLFLIIVILFLCVFWFLEIIPAYLSSHHVSWDESLSYYSDFFKNFDNRKLFFAVIFSSLIPIFYMIIAKNKKIYLLLIYLLIGLVSYSLFYIWIKASIVWAWFIMTLLNTTFVFLLMLYFILWVFSLWSFLKLKILKKDDKSIFDIFISFGIWLSVFLLLNYILIACSVFYSIISWIIFAGFWCFIYLQRKRLKDSELIISNVFNDFLLLWDTKNWIKYIWILLLLFSIMYFYYGFNLSFIPYPTAWDANHAYMYYPKVWAYSHGFDWTGNSITAWLGLWYSYIAYWFSLFSPLDWFLWISPDNIAIELNFLSWIFVLFFGLALLKEIVDLLSILSQKLNKNKEERNYDKNIQNIFYYTWRFLLLLWLTSWMGAFLVFVDNKTDLWVLSLVILAIYSWFAFLKKLYSEDKSKKIENNNSVQNYYYIVLSWFLFAIAIMSKSTGFIDALNFWIFLFWIWIWWIWALWIFLLVVWGLAFIKFRGISDYISSNDGFIWFVVWALFFGMDTIRAFINKKIIYLKYIAIWSVSIFATLLIFKWPYTFFYQLNISKDFSPSNFIKSLILSENTSNNHLEDQEKKILFGSKVYADETVDSLQNTGSAQDMTWIQTVLPQNITGSVSEVSNTVCSLGALWLTSTQDLYKSIKKIEDTTYQEDVGRYVWFWQRNFVDPWWGIMFPWYNACFGLDKEALLLCRNQSAIINYDLKKLKEIQNSLGKDSKPYQIISNILAKVDNNVDIEITDDVKSKIWDYMTNLQSYMEDNTISTHKVCTVNSSNNSYDKDCKVVNDDTLDKDKVVVSKVINIPYKYLTFFNITYNWSLQNNSSYYTDIGFIWLIVLMLNVFGLIYALIRLNKVLLAFTWITMFAWVVWFYIWWWILWYGMGLVVWNIISLMSFVYYLYSNKNNNEKVLFYVFLTLFFGTCFYQIWLNFIRIASQGSGWAFSYYRQGNWLVNDISISGWWFENKDVEKYGYWMKDVFGLQFWHYSKTIELADSRKDWEWMFIAGTYITYFIKDQKNIVYDQFLNRLVENFSDNNICASYLRLKDKWIKYITIDPNIWTVVMWWWNMSLFERFFAKINSVNWEVEDYWAVLMLSDMVSKWYIKYVSSNNLAAKYAFILTDEELMQRISDLDKNSIPLFRARLALMRYWQDQTLYKQFIANLASERVYSMDFISDLWDILGKKVDQQKIVAVIKLVLWNDNATDKLAEVQKEFDKLTTDEKLILNNYLQYYQVIQSNKDEFKQYITQLAENTVNSGSQIITLEVK